MKKRILSIFLCLVMVFSLLPFTASAASAIPINEETFPDPVFREYVLKIVGSSVLTEEKAQQIEVLDVSKDNIKKVLGDRAPITSLMGIRYLRYVKDLNCSGQELKKTLNLEQNSRVEKLNCSGNQLTGLWFHKGSSLKYLNCSVNEFTALNLSKNPELTELYCSNNKLTSLDLSANTKLQQINASSNKLTALDVRHLSELTHLYLWSNSDLRSIDVSKNPKLEFLSVSHCKLTSLNVSNNRKLVELFVYNNQLTALDVRSNYLLKTLDCYENQLTALDLSYNGALESLSVNDNPITELNLHPLSNLQKLSCSKMQLKKLDVDRCPKLRRLYCNDNQIETLDLRSNKKLETLYCQNNRLSWLNLSSNTALDPRYVDCSGNVYDIKVDENLQYKVYPDLPCYGATEGTYFTAARASDWTGGTVSKVDGWDVLTLDNRDVKEVTYKYDTGNAKIGKVAFTLKTEVPPKYITISFDPNGGTGTMKPMRVKAGVGYTLPECTFTPPEGKEFAGWLAENGTVFLAGDNVISFSSSVLKATWKDTTEVDVTQMFTDVEKNWAYPGIQYCVTHGIMGGMGDGTFAPTGTTTRAQIVQILYNLEGTPAVSGTTPFTDLTANWYKPAILWAYQNNVVAGTSPTTFAPDQPVTREQIAVILTQYMFHVLKMERTWTPADLSKFPDGAQVSSWAKEAMQDAVALGLINGTKAPDGLVYLDPQGSAARQQVATILMNFCQNVKK